MEGLYEIEFRYLDALNEPWHTANVVIYDSNTAFGANLRHAMDVADEDGDFGGVDKLLLSTFGVKDDDICFYLDLKYVDDSGAGRDTAKVLELQRGFDILVNNITFIQGV